MTSSPLPQEWDRFVSNLRSSDTGFLSSLQTAVAFSVKRSPQLPLARRRAAPHIVSSLRNLINSTAIPRISTEGALNETTDPTMNRSYSESSKPENRSSVKTKDFPEQSSVRRNVSSTPISSIRLQLNAQFFPTKCPFSAIDIVRYFLTPPYTAVSEMDPLLHKTLSLGILEHASALLRNLPEYANNSSKTGADGDNCIVPERDRDKGKDKDKCRAKKRHSFGHAGVQSVQSIKLLLENLFIDPGFLLETMNLGKVPSVDFFFEKISIPMFLKPPVLRMCLSIERLVVGMVSKEILEPFYGSIALYYHSTSDSGQDGLFRASEMHYFDMNNIFTLQYFSNLRRDGKGACPSVSALYERLMGLTTAIERSRAIEFLIPLSSQLCFSRIFLVVFLEKLIGVPGDEAHAFYARVREIEDVALADEKIRADVDRYSLHLQKLAEGVANHDVRVIAGVLNNKFHQKRYDSAVNRMITSTLTSTLTSDTGSSQTKSYVQHSTCAVAPSLSSSVGPTAAKFKSKGERHRGRLEIGLARFLGIDYARSGGANDDSKIPSNVFDAYGKYGEQLQAEYNKYVAKVKATVSKTGGLRETFAVSIAPIFPLSAFTTQIPAPVKRSGQSQEMVTIPHNFQSYASSTNVARQPQLQQDEEISVPKSGLHADRNSVSNPNLHAHLMANNISIMGVPRTTSKSEESLTVQNTGSQERSFTITHETRASIQQLENFLMLARVAYSKGSSILRKSGMATTLGVTQKEQSAEYDSICDAYSFFNSPDNTSFEQREVISRMYNYFFKQKERGACSATAFKNSGSFVTEKGTQAFVHPFRPVMHELNTFIRLPKTLPQTEPMSTTLLNLYNERVAKKRALGYIQMYINTSVNTFGTYDSQTGVFKVLKDAPSYYTLQPDHLPDCTQETELMLWTYGVHLLKTKNYDEILRLLKLGYFTSNTLNQILMLSLMDARGSAAARIYMTLRDAEVTLEHQRAFGSLQTRYFLDSIKGSKLHPKNIYIKQLDCFFNSEVGSPVSPFKNRMYFYPQSFIITVPNVRYRTFFLKVEMRNNDLLDNNDIAWAIYPRIHGAMDADDISNGHIVFRSSYITGTSGNARTGKLHDEIKFELPLKLTPKTHVFLTLYGVCDTTQKDKSQGEFSELSSIVGIDDTVFTPQEKTATPELNAEQYSSLYANDIHTSYFNGQIGTPYIHTGFPDKMSVIGSPLSPPPHTSPGKIPKYDSRQEYSADKLHLLNEKQIAHMQNIVEARSQLTLLGYAYLPIVKGVDDSCIPVLQNAIGIDNMSFPVMMNSEFSEKYDRTITLPLLSHIQAGYLTSSSDGETGKQSISDAAAKQPKQLGYMYCTLRYESHLYTHYHFINAINYAYSCAKSIVLEDHFHLEENIKTLRSFLENLSLYAAAFTVKKDMQQNNSVANMVVDDQRAQLYSINQLITPMFPNVASVPGIPSTSKRISTPLSRECALLDHYGSMYNIVVALASFLMHPKMPKEISRPDLLSNYSEHVVSLFTLISNESLAICNNIYQHCINEEIAAAFQAQKTVESYNTWFTIVRNFIPAPSLEEFFKPLFGPTSKTDFLYSSDFSVSRDIYKTLHGLGNNVSFSHQKQPVDGHPSSPFKTTTLLFNNFGLYTMISHYACSLTTLQDLQNYTTFLSYSILRHGDCNSATYEHLMETVPHNLLLIAKSFALVLSTYWRFFSFSPSSSACNESAPDGPVYPKHMVKTPTMTPLPSLSASLDDSETMAFEADLISFLSSILSLVETVLCSMARITQRSTFNKLSPVTISVAKFYTFLILQSPKRSKLLSLLGQLVDRFTTGPDISNPNSWMVLFNFLHQLMKERTLLYSYSFTDVYAGQSVLFSSDLADFSCPFKLITQSCIMPHLYIKALQHLLDVPVGVQAESSDRDLNFRTVHIAVLSSLWELLAIDMSLSTPSMTHVTIVPILLLLLNSYPALFAGYNGTTDAATPATAAATVTVTATHTRAASIHVGLNEKLKHVDSMVDFPPSLTTDVPPTPRGTAAESTTATTTTAATGYTQTSKGSSPGTPSPKKQHNDCSLEILVTEIFLLLITFLQTSTDYHTKFLHSITVTQARNMLAMYANIPRLFNVAHLTSRATILTSTSYRIQSIRYLRLLLSNKAGLSDNIFCFKNSSLLHSVPFLSSVPFSDNAGNFPANFTSMPTLDTLLSTSPDDSMSLANMILYSSAFGDVYSGKILKTNDESKQSRNTITIQPISMQHTTVHDPYYKIDKHNTMPDFVASQLLYPSAPRQRQAPLPSSVSFDPSNAAMNLLYIPRKAAKEHRDSTTSRPGSRNTKRPASKLHVRQGSKYNTASTLANGACLDDVDDDSICRVLEGSTDLQESQRGWKLANSTIGTLEDANKDSDLNLDGKESVMGHTMQAHKKRAGSCQLTENFSEGTSKYGEASDKGANSLACTSVYGTENTGDDLDTYLNLQIKSKKLSMLDACEIRLKNQACIEDSDRSEASGAILLQPLKHLPSDPIYAQLIESPEKLCQVTALILSTVIHEAALYQLFVFAQYLIDYSDPLLTSTSGLKDDSCTKNNASGGISDVRADVIYTLACFLTQDPAFAVYNELVLKALINYIPSLTPILFDALENKDLSFDQGISTLVEALLLQVDSKHAKLKSLSATIIIMLLKMEFDHHINTFVLFSKINCSLIVLDLTDEKKKSIIQFFEYVKIVVKSLCSSKDSRSFGVISEDKTATHEINPIAGKLALICKHFYAAVSLFYERLLIVVESEYRIKQRSKIQSMGETIVDVDLYAELKLSQADCYVGQVELRLLSLQSLLSFLREHNRHIEAGVVSLLIAGLISEYLVVKSSFIDLLINYANAPTVYSVAKVLIPELRKLIPDITVQNDLDIWFSYLAKMRYLAGKEECIYSSLDGGQFIDLLTALQDAATEFKKAKFYGHVSSIYSTLVALADRYAHYIRAGGDLFTNFTLASLLPLYQKALADEQRSYEHAPATFALVNYYWVSITTEVSGGQSQAEYIYCCPIIESIREFTERLQRFYDAPEHRGIKSKPKVSVQKVECYKAEQSEASITYNEHKIKERILNLLLSYDTAGIGKEDSSNGSSILGDTCFNTHLVALQTEPALHFNTELQTESAVLLPEHTAKSLQLESRPNDTRTTSSSFYNGIIYNYYPFVLSADDKIGTDTAHGTQTAKSFLSRQIFERRIQLQPDQENLSINLSGCLCIYYFVPHPFPHTNSRQRVIYRYEEYSSPIQEAIRIIERAIHETRNLPHDVNKVFQNLVGMVTPSVNSGTMDIVRAFLRKIDEVSDTLQSTVKVVDFDDLVSSSTTAESEKAEEGSGKDAEANAPAGVTGENSDSYGEQKHATNNVLDRLLSPEPDSPDASKMHDQNSDWQVFDNSAGADSPQHGFQDSAFDFYRQRRKSLSSPTVEDAIVQFRRQDSVMNSSSTYLLEVGEQSNASRILTRSHSEASSTVTEVISENDTHMTETATSAALANSLLEKNQFPKESDDTSSIDFSDSDDSCATYDRAIIIKKNLQMHLYRYNNCIIVPDNTPAELSQNTAGSEGENNREDDVHMNSLTILDRNSSLSCRFTGCPGLSEVFLSLAVYPKLISRTEFALKYHRNPYGNTDERALHAPRQGSYLAADSTQCGSSQESRRIWNRWKSRHSNRRLEKEITMLGDNKAYSASPYGTSRESGYHGRFNIAGFASNAVCESSTVTIPPRLTREIEVLLADLPVSCRMPNALSPDELTICQDRLGKLIVELIDLQAHTFVLAAHLLRLEKNYQALYLQARDYFLKMLEELKDYVYVDTNRIHNIVFQVTV